MISFKYSTSKMIELISDTFHGELYNTCIQCPDRKSFKNSKFFFLNTYANIEYFLNKYPEAKWFELDQILKEYYEFKKNEKQLLAIDKTDFTNSDFKFKTKPYDHQLQAFEISKNLKEYGLLFEQGCGKSKVIIDNADYLYQQGKIDTLIIIAPNGVHKNWLTEEKIIHSDQKYIEFIWQTNFNKKSMEDWNTFKYIHTLGLNIFSFNIETFVSEKSRKELIDILKHNKCMLVVDESHKIKNPSAKRTKFLIEISKLPLYKRILTGTPIANGAQGFYTQFKFLNPNIIGISSYYAFRAKYCVMGGWENKQIIGYKHIEELQNKIKAYSMRVLKKDCLDLPDKIYQEEMFDMTKQQRMLYEEVKEEGIASLNEGEPLIFDNIMAKMAKLRQISSGFIKEPETGKCIEIVPMNKNPRLLKLLDLLEQINGKVIIWTTQIYDIDIIMKTLQNKAVRYDGQISSEEKEQNKNRFKTDPNIKYFVINIQMPEGLTLTEAETTIYYTNTFDLEKRIQSEDRNHRIGTKNNVNYIDICCNQTIDKKIVRILRKKKTISEMILQDPKSFFLEY